MVKVRNKHCASILGVLPGEVVDMKPEVLEKHRWAFVEVNPAPRTPPRRVKPPSMGIKQARRLIKAAGTLEALEPFLSDARSTIRQAAKARRDLLEHVQDLDAPDSNTVQG